MSRQSPSLFLRAFSGQNTKIPPIWLMRQAGRHLSEYRAVREQAGSFLDLCYDPERASIVTLQPVERYDVDAAILFADILLIPHALGQNLRFEAGEGPKLEPVTTAKTLSSYADADIQKTLAPIYETVRQTRAKLSPDKALIGFAGAPWTVATYMLAGGSVKDTAGLRHYFYQDPDFLMALIDLLTERTIEYLRAQCDAGCDAIQIFDSWAGGLPLAVLKSVSVDPMEKIASALEQSHPNTPVILFPRGVGESAVYYQAGSRLRGFGIDYSADPAWVAKHLTDRFVVQGGMDPLVLQEGGAALEDAARLYLKTFKDHRYIFNLGHGITPITPPAHVEKLISIIRESDEI